MKKKLLISKNKENYLALNSYIIMLREREEQSH